MIVWMMERPRPVPGMARCVAFEARKKRVKRSFLSASGIPMPVSATDTTAHPPAVSVVSSMRPPSGVNFTALDRRFVSTRTSWLASPSTTRPSAGRAVVRVMSLAATAGSGALGAPGDDVQQVDGPGHRGERARLDRREREQVLDQFLQPDRVPADPLQRALLLGAELAQLPVQQHLHIARDAGKRGAQLVRHRRDEVRLRLVDGPQLLDQAVLLLVQVGMMKPPPQVGRYRLHRADLSIRPRMARMQPRRDNDPQQLTTHPERGNQK